MISVNFKRNALSALVAVGVMTMAAGASAQVAGGGATLPEGLYGKALTATTSSTGILNKTAAGTVPSPGFNAYVGVGSGAGKNSFFQNNSGLLTVGGAPYYSPAVTVDYAGSDSLVTAAEQSGYDAHTTLGKTSFGRLIQVPAVLTSVTVPYNIAGRTSVNLTSAQLAQIFADPTITNWNQVPGFSALNQPIKVIYRSESSGTTEIFLRHLNAVNNTLVPSVGTTYASVVNVSNTSKYIPATGSDGVVAALAANPYSITYVSPDKVAFADATKVVAITRTISGVTSNLLPTEVNVTAALTGINPPAASAPATSWGIGYVASGVSPLANPSAGYPIVGATNLIFSQCYASAADNVRIRNFFRQHYNTTDNDAAITAHSFIKLPANWRTAVFDAFYTATSPESIGYTSVCTGKGRPA
ncbi:substrate-binding domain-containing protein [Variovorax paradoxus]|jgi:ABC-type phosphate transport system substrate-binding protein|uniref:substrate-binding domain-containing protein n=1 Tax=Variovorax TaxID=34072 RepID=UPI001ABBFAE2